MSNELRLEAIRLLARREHSRAELARRLASLGTPEEIEALLVELEATQLQSDRRVAESYLRGKAARLGGARLRRELKTRGLDAELIEEQLEQSGIPDEMARARAIWARKFSEPPGNAKEWARQSRFLQSRGFAAEVVRRLLKDPREEAEA